MVYVISDLHGYPHEKLVELLSEAGFGEDDFLYVLGDVIDRNGDGGAATLEWLLYQPNVQLILGNHEAMMLACAFVFDEINDAFLSKFSASDWMSLQTWRLNGADNTLAGMKGLSRETQQDILDYLRDCPLYETVSCGGKDYVLVHGGFGNFSVDRPLSDYAPEELFWSRPDLDEAYFPEVMTILGHTPTICFGPEFENRIVRTPTWMDIDMGCGFGHEPVLLRLDDLQEFRLSE